MLGRQILPIDKFSLVLHQPDSSIQFDKILPGKTYANNFIFTKNQAAIAKWQRVVWLWRIVEKKLTKPKFDTQLLING